MVCELQVAVTGDSRIYGDSKNYSLLGKPALVIIINIGCLLA